MKVLLSVLTVCFLTVFSSLSAKVYGLDGDQWLKSEIYKREFSNSVIQYSYGAYTYPVRVIYNPYSETLWGGDLENPVDYALIMVGNLPIDLIHHLESVLYEMGFNADNSYIELRGYCDFTIDELESVRPVYVARSVYDRKNDTEIRAIFNSYRFVNEVFTYNINGNYYRVRIINNPDGRTLTASRRFELEPGDPVRNYTVSWSKKYGIFTDKQVPDALIDHLADLSEVGWWDWQFNFSIKNGTCVEYETTSYGLYTNTVTTYFLDTWFLYTEDFY